METNNLKEKIKSIGETVRAGGIAISVVAGALCEVLPKALRDMGAYLWAQYILDDFQSVQDLSREDIEHMLDDFLRTNTFTRRIVYDPKAPNPPDLDHYDPILGENERMETNGELSDRIEATIERFSEKDEPFHYSRKKVAKRFGVTEPDVKRIAKNRGIEVPTAESEHVRKRKKGFEPCPRCNLPHNPSKECPEIE